MAFDFENGSYTDAAGRTVLRSYCLQGLADRCGGGAGPAPWWTGSCQKLGLLPEELLPMARPPSWTSCGSWSAQPSPGRTASILR